MYRIDTTICSFNVNYWMPHYNKCICTYLFRRLPACETQDELQFFCRIKSDPTAFRMRLMSPSLLKMEPMEIAGRQAVAMRARDLHVMRNTSEWHVESIRRSNSPKFLATWRHNFGSRLRLISTSEDGLFSSFPSFWWPELRFNIISDRRICNKSFCNSTMLLFRKHLLHIDVGFLSKIGMNPH